MRWHYPFFSLNSYVPEARARTSIVSVIVSFSSIYFYFPGHASSTFDHPSTQQKKTNCTSQEQKQNDPKNVLKIHEIIRNWKLRRPHPIYHQRHISNYISNGESPLKSNEAREKDKQTWKEFGIWRWNRRMGEKNWKSRMPSAIYRNELFVALLPFHSNKRFSGERKNAMRMHIALWALITRSITLNRLVTLEIDQGVDHQIQKKNGMEWVLRAMSIECFKRLMAESCDWFQLFDRYTLIFSLSSLCRFFFLLAIVEHQSRPYYCWSSPFIIECGLWYLIESVVTMEHNSSLVNSISKSTEVKMRIQWDFSILKLTNRNECVKNRYVGVIVVLTTHCYWTWIHKVTWFFPRLHHLSYLILWVFDLYL